MNIPLNELTRLKSVPGMHQNLINTTREQGKYRVLLIAEMCNPNWTSVPLVGYQLARALAEHPKLEVTLVTQVRNRSALEGDPINEHARVIIIDSEFVAKPVYKLSKFFRGGDKLSWTIDTAMMWPSYVVFEQLLERIFRQKLKSGAFDLIHRLTPLSPTIPSPLANMTKVPMIFGPVNGGLKWPKEYPELVSLEKEWLTNFRKVYRAFPFFRSSYCHFAGVICGSKATAQDLPNYYRGQRFYLPENGIDPKRFPLANNWPEVKDKFRFITISRLVPYKAVDITLEAIAGSPLLRQQCEFVICGDGPERTSLENLIQKHQLTEMVQFKNWLSQSELAKELSSSQIFVFPSLREFGGGVVLEAMSAGVPPIIVDYGGPGELVDDSCGIKIPMLPRQELIHQLRQAMEFALQNPDQCQRMSKNAVQKIRSEFTWSAKADKITDIYRSILAKRHSASAISD